MPYGLEAIDREEDFANPRSKSQYFRICLRSNVKEIYRGWPKRPLLYKIGDFLHIKLRICGNEGIELF